MTVKDCFESEGGAIGFDADRSMAMADVFLLKLEKY